MAGNSRNVSSSSMKRFNSRRDFEAHVDRLYNTESETKAVSHTWTNKKPHTAGRIKRISAKAFKRLLGNRYEERDGRVIFKGQ